MSLNDTGAKLRAEGESSLDALILEMIEEGIEIGYYLDDAMNKIRKDEPLLLNQKAVLLYLVGNLLLDLSERRLL